MVLGEFDSQASLNQVRAGDPEAARSLIEALYPSVIRIVRSHLPLHAREQNLAEEIFVKALSQLDHYDQRGSLEDWIGRLAVRTCLEALRAERPRPRLRMADLAKEEAAWLEFMVRDEAAPPAGGLDPARDLLEKMLWQLPLEDRLVINLLDLQASSVNQIASLTGWDSSVIKVRATRARENLRKLAATVQPE
jgi:RNA polymerase sigma factor (sigma-70 family)